MALICHKNKISSIILIENLIQDIWTKGVHTEPKTIETLCYPLVINDLSVWFLKYWLSHEKMQRNLKFGTIINNFKNCFFVDGLKICKIGFTSVHLLLRVVNWYTLTFLP